MEPQKRAKINEIEKRGYCYKSQGASKCCLLKDKHDVYVLTNMRSPPQWMETSEMNLAMPSDPM
jgi:hypothetical protein